jgi:hypothetical protein
MCGSSVLDGGEALITSAPSNVRLTWRNEAKCREQVIDTSAPRACHQVSVGGDTHTVVRGTVL